MKMKIFREKPGINGEIIYLSELYVSFFIKMLNIMTVNDTVVGDYINTMKTTFYLSFDC